MNRAHIFVTSALLIIAGCRPSGENQVDAVECWNPKLLRVEVGNSVFDLPKNVDFINASGRIAIGIQKIKPSQLDDDDNRQNCQFKSNVPIKLDDEVYYRFFSEKGVFSPLTGEIISINSKNLKTNQKKYLATGAEVAHVRFVGEKPAAVRNGIEVTRELKFSFKGKYATMICQVGGSQMPGKSTWIEGSTFPHSCVGGIPIRMGNEIITFRDPNMLHDQVTGKGVMENPAFWPSRWVEVVNKINSYRVNGKGE